VSGLKRRDKLVLGLLVLALHGAAAYWVSQAPTPELPVVPQVPPMTIEFAAPAPPVVEPPPPAPAPPVVEPPPPRSSTNWPPSPNPNRSPCQSLWSSKRPSHSPSRLKHHHPRQWRPRHRLRPHHPRRPDNPGIGQRRVPEEPAPEYPQMAQRRGWEGTVLLRVEVLPSGKPGRSRFRRAAAVTPSTPPRWPR
jgi:protein TonB